MSIFVLSEPNQTVSIYEKSHSSYLNCFFSVFSNNWSLMDCLHNRFKNRSGWIMFYGTYGKKNDKLSKIIKHYSPLSMANIFCYFIEFVYTAKVGCFKHDCPVFQLDVLSFQSELNKVHLVLHLVSWVFILFFFFNIKWY